VFNEEFGVLGGMRIGGGEPKYKKKTLIMSTVTTIIVVLYTKNFTVRGSAKQKAIFR
jgi:hypothetical protein